jgi:hypothetical protein
MPAAYGCSINMSAEINDIAKYMINHGCSSTDKLIPKKHISKSSNQYILKHQASFSHRKVRTMQS